MGRTMKKTESRLVLAVQYLRFLLVGGGATLVHLSAFALLIELAGQAPLLANLLAFSAAVGVSYMGHYHWTFREHTAGAEVGFHRVAFARFLLAALTGLGLNTAIVWIVTGPLGAPYWYAMALMGTLVPAVVFTLGRLWVFSKPGHSEPRPVN